MGAMTRHRSHSAAFKRQVAGEFIAGETLHASSKRHHISRQLIRIWVGKFEAGALDNDVQRLTCSRNTRPKSQLLNGWWTTGVRDRDAERGFEACTAEKREHLRGYR